LLVDTLSGQCSVCQLTPQLVLFGSYVGSGFAGCECDSIICDLRASTYSRALVSCPHYISDEGFATLSNIIETVSKQQIEFANKMREYNLSPETNLGSSAPKLDVNLCDDGASFPPLESGIGKVIDPPLTTLPIIAPSSPSPFRNNIAFIMTYPDPPFPLTQSTKFEVGEIFYVDASVNENDICYVSEDVFIEVHDLDETLVRRSCMDVMVAVSPSLDLVDHVSPDPLDVSHASSCSLPSPSPEY